jgi:hypothetical protein
VVQRASGRNLFPLLSASSLLSEEGLSLQMFVAETTVDRFALTLRNPIPSFDCRLATQFPALSTLQLRLANRGLLRRWFAKSLYTIGRPREKAQE